VPRKQRPEKTWPRGPTSSASWQLTGVSTNNPADSKLMIRILRRVLLGESAGAGRWTIFSQIPQEINQSCHFSRADLFPVGRHIPATGGAVADLIDELVSG
jgi:hypothetical protein